MFYGCVMCMFCIVFLPKEVRGFLSGISGLSVWSHFSIWVILQNCVPLEWFVIRSIWHWSYYSKFAVVGTSDYVNTYFENIRPIFQSLIVSCHKMVVLENDPYLLFFCLIILLLFLSCLSAFGPFSRLVFPLILHFPKGRLLVVF